MGFSESPVGVPNLTIGPFDGPQWPHIAPRGTYVTVAILMGTVVILASFMNGMVILVSVRYKRLRSPLNYILVNLAMADLMVTFFGSTISFSNNINGYFTLGQAMCQFEGFMVSLTGIVGLWSLAILAFERYIIICKPMGDFRFQQRHAVWGCLFTWIWALVWTMPPLLGWSSYVPEGCSATEGVSDDTASRTRGDPYGGRHGDGVFDLLASLYNLCPSCCCG
ncbi:pinopsin-like isoform X2 [Chiloscyllium plagiosum]|uniref:pinopsin-like isoform X2 n=1 Tax=Chiloscyllium plagiosum TaxID=36176 RepID=UPI001CB7EA6F|nr:pinopsin-like isoform X2 [Chiloscyllium plagiosum]